MINFYYRSVIDSRKAGVITLLILLSLFFIKPAYAYQKARVTSDTNVRVDSTALSASLGYLKKGEIVKVIEERYDWCKVILPRQMSCYVSAQFVRKIADNKVEVSASQLNLRSEPQENSYIVGKVSKGTILFIKGEFKNGWLKVRGHPYMYGWVNKKFLQQIQAMLDVEANGIIFAYKPKQTKCKANYLLQNEKGELLVYLESTGGKNLIRKKVRVIGRMVNDRCAYLAVKKIFIEK